MKEKLLIACKAKISSHLSFPCAPPDLILLLANDKCPSHNPFVGTIILALRLVQNSREIPNSAVDWSNPPTLSPPEEPHVTACADVEDVYGNCSGCRSSVSV